MKTSSENSPLDLLEEEVNLLESFVTLTYEELQKVRQRDFLTLETFYMQRDRLLDLIQAINEYYLEERKSSASTPEQLSRIEELLESRGDYINQILRLDLELISIIDQEKTSVIQELQVVSGNRRALKAYRSGL